MKKIAIIIAAHDCAEYIIDCIDSVKNQIVFPGWKIYIRIGVDGCKKTADVLNKNKIKYYWSPKSNGPYVMRNSLIYLYPADVYSYFDADDVMIKNYCKRTIQDINKTGFVMGAKINCDINLKPKSRPVVENGGAMSFKHKIIETVGGFANYRCAADTDFMRRAEMAGYKIHKIKDPIYYRRSHPKSLTKRSATGMGSAYRKQSWAAMTVARKKGIIKIKPVLVKLREIE